MCYSITCRRTIEQELDIHPSRKAIVVHYAVEAMVFDEYGEPMVADSKECVKMYIQTLMMYQPSDMLSQCSYKLSSAL